mmetsp:Transcript_16083/g.49745  ORF Transcript_16083/g.49745 Transcript_16083/m.49745 type:complete len:145 (-) Transcript_16083:78-512(-)
MLALRTCVVAAVIASRSTRVCAFDLTWIPADGEGPLPLSKSYRDQLSRLCALLETASALPPSIEARRGDVEKMCAKLRDAERAAAPRPLAALPKVAALGAAGAWAWRSYASRGWLYKVVRANAPRRSATPLRPPKRSSTGLFDL